MCFRPSEAFSAINCPKCDTINPSVAKVCRNCGEDFTALKAAMEAGGAAAPVAAPSAPVAPQVPGAPSAPKAPEAPKS